MVVQKQGVYSELVLRTLQAVHLFEGKDPPQLALNNLGTGNPRSARFFKGLNPWSA